MPGSGARPPVASFRDRNPGLRRHTATKFSPRGRPPYPLRRGAARDRPSRGSPGQIVAGQLPYRTDWQGIHGLIGEVLMTAVSRRSFLLTGGTAAAAVAAATGAGATLLAPAAGAA